MGQSVSSASSPGTLAPLVFVTLSVPSRSHVPILVSTVTIAALLHWHRLPRALFAEVVANHPNIKKVLKPREKIPSNVPDECAEASETH